MGPILSVIVPVYNTKDYIERCVESLCGQTLKEIEILLIDDGSTDGSGDVCDRLAMKDARIKVLHKQNEGQGIARNCGIEAAKGKYVTFIDSDDYMEKEAYQYLVEKAAEYQTDVICFGYSKDDPYGSSMYKSKIRGRCYLGEEVKREFALHFFGDDPEDDDMRGVSACMSVYRMGIIKEHKICFPSERKVLSEDTIFNLEFCRFADIAVSCERIFYHYCIQADSFSRGYSKERLEKTAEFMKILSGYAKEWEIESLTANRIQMVLWVSLLDAVRKETARKGLSDYPALRSSIHEICNKEYVLRLMDSLDTKGMGLKQKVFFQCMKRKSYFFLIILTYLRNRNGLQK